MLHLIFFYCPPTFGSPCILTALAKKLIFFIIRSRRVARIWKRGGYFERVRSVQTTLTRIFIDLESVADGLSEN